VLVAAAENRRRLTIMDTQFRAAEGDRTGRDRAVAAPCRMVESLAICRIGPKGREVDEHREEPLARVYDRNLLLHGAKRNAILTLNEVQQYGIDSFPTPIICESHGMSPTQWYVRGIRLLGRTAVECTRDSLGNRIGAMSPASPP